MLGLIAKALTDFNDGGYAVIAGDGEHEARVVAEYVLQVLKGLKCSFNVQYIDHENSVIIDDGM